MTQVEFIKAFNAFPTKQKIAIAKKIQLQMADELFDNVNTHLPNFEISTEEIQNEIMAYRNAKKEKN